MKQDGSTLIKSGMLVVLSFLLSRGAAAQTTVTETGGAANSVPVFTSASAVKSSVITQSGSNIGIGMTTPSQKLSIGQGSLNFDNYGFVSSYRGPLNNYTDLFLGGSITDDGNGTYTVQTDGGSNYFAAIRMDNAGGNAGAINFYTDLALRTRRS